MVAAGFTLLYVYSLQCAQDETGFSRRAVEGRRGEEKEEEAEAEKEEEDEESEQRASGGSGYIAKRELETRGGRRWSFDRAVL